MGNPQEDWLLQAGQIAKLAGVRPSTVSMWLRRHDGFPQPVATGARGGLWRLGDVAEWLRSNDRDVLFGAVSPAEAALTGAEALRAGMSADEAHLSLLCLAAVSGISKGQPDLRQAIEVSRAELDSPAADALLERLGNLQGPDADRIYAMLAPREPRGHESDLAPARAAAFEEILARTPRMARLSEAMLPADQANTVAALLPRGISSVLDPQCGVGDLLAAVASAQPGLQKVAGQDHDASAAGVAALRLRIRGLSADIHIGAALEEDLFASQEFDAAVSAARTAGPMSRTESRRFDSLDSRWALGLPDDGDSTWLWAQHLLARIRPNGVAILVTDERAARGGGKRPPLLRTQLLLGGALEAVVALPGNRLAWLMRRSRDQEREQTVLMLDSRELRDPAALGWMLDAWRHSGTLPIEGSAAAVPLKVLLHPRQSLHPDAWTGRSDDEGLLGQRRLSEAMVRVSRAQDALASIGPVPAVSLEGFRESRTETLAELERLGYLEVVGIARASRDPGSEANEEVRASAGDLVIRPLRSLKSSLLRVETSVSPGGLVQEGIVVRLKVDWWSPTTFAALVRPIAGVGRSSRGLSLESVEVLLLSPEHEKAVAPTFAALSALETAARELVYSAAAARREMGLAAPTAARIFS